MFPRRGRAAANKKRTRAEHDETPSAPIKSRARKKDAQHLPDYLAKRKDAEQLRDLLASERDPIIYKKMLDIAKKCHDRKFNLEYLHDWLAIYQFLHQPDLVNAYLDRLEAALQTSADDLAKQKKSTRKASQHQFAQHKILSNYLFDWAAEQGFKQKAKFIALLPADGFLSMLRAKTIFKDSSISANINHGAWSHALQWYLIVERFKDTPFIMHRPLEVLQSFGDVKQLQTSRMLNLAWDFVLDRSGEDFFTSPTSITAYLSDDTQCLRWPILTACVMRQEDKANHKFGSYHDYTQHLAEKYLDANGASPKMIVTKL